MVILKKINAKGKQRHIKALSDDEMKNLFGGYSFPVDSVSCSSRDGIQDCSGICPPHSYFDGIGIRTLERTCVFLGHPDGQHKGCICAVLDEYDR